jgi:hypothetical protein
VWTVWYNDLHHCASGGSVVGCGIAVAIIDGSGGDVATWVVVVAMVDVAPFLAAAEVAVVAAMGVDRVV